MATSGHQALKSALDGLAAALDRLDAAASRQAEKFRNAGALHDAMTVMREDRMRLAGELDKALSRSNGFEAALNEVSGKLDASIAAVRELIEEA